MLVDGIGQNYVYDNDSYSTAYINFIAALPEIRQPAASPEQNALVIGLGAGQLPMMLQKLGLYVEAVEIDPKVGAIAKKQFDFDLPADRIHYTDGRVFLLRNDASYEYIVIDAFSAEQIGGDLVTLEALTEAKARLSNGGMLVINITSTTTGKDIAAVHNTLKSAFSDVRSFSLEQHNGLASIVLLASSMPILLNHDRASLSASQLEDVKLFVAGEVTDLQSDILLTDDYNPISHQRGQVQLLWREVMIDYLGDDNLGWLLL